MNDQVIVQQPPQVSAGPSEPGAEPCRLCHGRGWAYCTWCKGTGYTVSREECSRARRMNVVLWRAQRDALERDDS